MDFMSEFLFWVALDLKLPQLAAEIQEKFAFSDQPWRWQ